MATKAKTTADIVKVLQDEDTPEWRLSLANKIQSGEIKVKYPSCDISKLKNIEGIPSNSVSTSAIFHSEHEDEHGNRRPVILKSSFDLEPKAYLIDNSLPIEFVNYRLIANEMVNRRWTPHLVTTVATFQCSDKDLKAHPILYDNIYGDLYAKYLETKKIGSEIVRDCKNLWCLAIQKNVEYSPLFDTLNMNFIVTERMKGKTLKKWCMEQHTVDEWKTILFQVLYTLECFNRINFRHNDLHLGNIFVESTSLKHILYIIDTDSAELEYVKVPTHGYTARIYDFDRSGMVCTSGSYNNAYEDFVKNYEHVVQYVHPVTRKDIHGPDKCENVRVTNADCSWGACQQKNHKFDAFTFLGLIWASDPEIRRKIDSDPEIRLKFQSRGLFLGEIIPNDVIDFIESHIHRNAFAGKNFKGMKNFDPLTTNWNWGMRSSMIEKGLVRRYGKNNNMELPEESMDSVEMMLKDTSFFNFQRGDIKSLAADCKDSDIYHMPMRPGRYDQHDYSKLTCAVDIVNNWGKVEADDDDDRLDMISDRRLAMVPDPEPDRLDQMPAKKVWQKRWARELERGSNSSATSESGEPFHARVPANRSV
jgi:tRNA A-37 threonylcarbamoyl transferase component Bud32